MDPGFDYSLVACSSLDLDWEQEAMMDAAVAGQMTDSTHSYPPFHSYWPGQNSKVKILQKYKTLHSEP